MKYIDIHSHVYFPDYDADREAVISRAILSDIGMITVGTDVESSKKALELTKQHENMWAVVGLHPVDADKFDYEVFKELALHPKVVAIGECGLDYFHEPFEANRQRDIFIRHINLANEVGKPLMLHVRNGKNANAYQDALAILKEYAKTPFNFHFFAGTPRDLKDIIAAGGYVSFTGVITFVRDYDSVVAQTPLDRIMSETDAPFVSPAPYRGKRNESSYVVEVARTIAAIRQKNAVQPPETLETEEIILAALVKNAKIFFRI